MGLPEPKMTVDRARTKWKKYGETREAAIELIEAGWHLFEHAATGKVSAWCPHGRPTSGKPVRLNATPQNDGSHARRVLRQSRYCPDRHDLLDAR